VLGETATTILRAVDEHGALLVHDQRLASVTALVAGSPVAGSWWSHPLGNAIYNALGELEDDVATVKLVNAKQTLVARRLWPELAGLGAAGDAWQTDGLDAEARALLLDIAAAPAPVAVDAGRRRAADSLERRLLVQATEVHTPSGRHVKAYQPWAAWAGERGVVPMADGARARAAFDAIALAQSRPGVPATLPW